MTDHDPAGATRQQHVPAEHESRLSDPPTAPPARVDADDRPPTTYVEAHEERHITVSAESDMSRLDRIRWSSVWAGLVVALGIYLFLQLALVATGIVDLADATSTDAWWSAAAALVAFFVGGVVAGATAVWRSANDGLLHGIVMWAVGLVALIALAAFGGGIALGSFDTSDVFDDFTEEGLDDVASGDDAEEAAGWALIGLSSALAASAVGATIGSKMWPRREDRDDSDHRTRTSF